MALALLLRLEKVNGLLPDHPGNHLFPRTGPGPAAHQDLRVPPSDLVEEEEAPLIDVGDLQADLIDMPCQHHPGPAGQVQAGHGVPRDIGPNLLREPLRLLPPDPGRAHLEPGRARGIQELFQKLDDVRTWRGLEAWRNLDHEKVLKVWKEGK